MRLIDADRFYINYARRFSREPLKVEFFKQFLDAEPTVCDIEQLRAEIAEYKDDKIIHAERNEMIDIVLELIDKYK